MKISGADLKNTIGNIAERNLTMDFGTGYNPLAATVTAPTQKPTPGFTLN